MTLHYLKQTVKGEPLVWKWYAWPHLIAPQTAAVNIVERHLKIMQSYVQNPQIHAQAVKDPKMVGGPFIDLNGKQIDEVKDLIAFTEEHCKKLINLCRDIKIFDKILQSQAKGDTLENLYSQIPTSIKGMVELVYDLNHHPSMRYIEPFLYNKYYDTSCQMVVLSDTTKDFRKFVLSTPYLNEDGVVSLAIPFSDKKLDQLFSMKEEGGDIEKIISLFNIPSEKEDLFRSLFTIFPPQQPKDRNYYGKGIRIKYFGHACLLVQTEKVSILFDPVISYPIPDSEVPRYTFEDLPDSIDYVVITHNHQDHLMFETLLQLRPRIKHIVFPVNNKGALEDPSIKLILEHTGFSSLIELDETQSVLLEEGEIIGLPFFGEHSDLNIHSKLSYALKIKGKTLMFAADSNNLDPYLYDHISEYTGALDMLFLGMECDGAPLTWLYGPLLSSTISRGFDKNRTLSGSDFNKAWAIIEKLQCQNVYIYAMGQEPWLGYIMGLKYTPESPQIIESNKLLRACQEKGINAERLFGKKEWVIGLENT